MTPPATLPVAEIIDVELLWQSIVAAIVAGVAITTAFALGLLGWTRARHDWDDGRRPRAMAWGAVCAVSTLVFVGAVVLGLALMVSD